ncbi:zinc finger protein 271 [Drosophila rhopaloa]|uniref:C2H2-type domain-containing protein n=1 Tax=Drosophila rhopaloa TaxID=1041015 RepID=A0ABM5I735_DRORH|nr:zinc finger protein 271 [Drosophila rhopaloa]
MELALNKTSSCVDCCNDCTLMSCCSAAACCDASCEASCALIQPDPVRYEYEEPEENFVSIDDVKIKGFLWRIGQQQQEKELEIKRIKDQEKKEKERREAEVRKYQKVIELDDEEVQPAKGLIISAARSLAHWNSSIKRISPDFELIPRQGHRIVAEIELSDSDQDPISEAEEEVNLPSNTVRCVLNEQKQKESQVPSPQEQVIIVHSDQEEEQEPEAVIRKKPSTSRRSAKKRPYVNRRGRHLFECPDCGKKVQSNYNLRRHMMIHTGERPFPCDLCERRFREFSDLKKHRRRHSHDPRFICMICHLGQPLEQDSTRCVDCESKNLMVKPQPEELGDRTVEDHPEEMEEDEEEVEEEDEPEEEMQPQPKVPPTLLVTLIPPIQSPPEKVPHATQPSRPPLPRSCSSANSSSSLSNDGNISGKPVNRSRRSYPCPLCHRPFGTRHNLKRHYMIHTGEKPFSCSKCRKPFRECSTLKKHMVTHVRDRWYKCLRCPSKFRDYLEYADHKTSHLDQLRTPSSTYESEDDGDSSIEDCLECCECHQRFTELDAYTAHLKQHDLELYGMSVDDVVDEEQDEVDVA